METIFKNLRIITAPNPGPMTYFGTNTYILGSGSGLAIIDPGPNCEKHYKVLKSILEVEKASHIIVTHSHLDHSSIAKRLSKEFSIPIFAHGNPKGARSEFMKKIMKSSKNIGGLEGLDLDFIPDVFLLGGEIIMGNNWNLEVLYTPGHLSDHLSFSLKEEGIIFSGDLVMGWTSTLISPPHGDVGHYYSSLNKLLNRPEDLYFPGHGEKINNARSYVTNLKKHKLNREKQILRILYKEDANSDQIAQKIYKNLPDSLVRAGARNVLAHLINLLERNLVVCDQPISSNSFFSSTS